MGSKLFKHGAIAQVMDWDDNKKSDKPQTEEERKKARAEKASELQGRKRVITGGITKGGSRNESVGAEVLLNADGNGFTFGPSSDPSAQFKWNEKTGDYRSNGGGILELAEIAAPAPQPSSGGGGGGGVPQQAQGQGLLAEYNPEYVRYNQGGVLNQGLTTEQIVGGPLHPGQEEWIYQTNPNHQVAPDLGTYMNQQWRPLV
jgi:hypothetical protein